MWREQEEEEGEKTARTELCTVLSPDPEMVWLGRGKGEEWEEGSVLLLAPRNRRQFSRCMVLGFFFLEEMEERLKTRDTEFEI